MNNSNGRPETACFVYYSIGENLSHRISLMRGILTLMVVNIHSINLVVHFSTGDVSWGNVQWLETVEYFFSEVVSRVAVPAFFFLSALLLYRRTFSWTENIIRKIRSLVIPYFIVNTFWIAIYLVLQSIPSLSAFFTMDGFIIRNWDLMGWLKGYGFFSPPLVAPLWFIRDLFVLNVLSKIIKKVLCFAPIVFALLLLFFWLSPLSTHIFFLDKQALCFWCFGYLCVQYRFDLQRLDKYRKPWFIGLYLVAVILDVSLKTNDYNWIIHNIGILIGIVFWFVFGTTVKSEFIRKKLLLISEYSFGVYLFHQLTLNCINKLYARFVPSGYFSQLFGYIVVPIAVIAGSIGVSILMKKKAMWLYCIMFGKDFCKLK